MPVCHEAQHLLPKQQGKETKFGSLKLQGRLGLCQVSAGIHCCQTGTWNSTAWYQELNNAINDSMFWTQSWLHCHEGKSCNMCSFTKVCWGQLSTTLIAIEQSMYYLQYQRHMCPLQLAVSYVLCRHTSEFLHSNRGRAHAFVYCLLFVQIPRWDLDRFHQTPKEIGSAMKSVGEVGARCCFTVVLYQICALR